MWLDLAKFDIFNFDEATTGMPRIRPCSTAIQIDIKSKKTYNQVDPKF